MEAAVAEPNAIDPGKGNGIMRKLGLCLSGGGGKGAYHVGACQALAEWGIFQQVSVFSGTSIGAANVALLASTSLETTRNLWFSLSDDVLKRNATLKTILQERLKAIDEGIFRIDALEDVLMKSIDHSVLDRKDVFVTVSEGGEEGHHVTELLKTMYEHYVNKDVKVHYLPLRSLSVPQRLQAIVASCSIPVVFPAVVEGSTKYYDGGVFDNVPIRPLVEAGCEEIITIRLNRLAPFHPEEFPDIPVFDVIHPTSVGSPLDFSREHVIRTYELGYRDTLAALRKIPFLRP